MTTPSSLSLSNFVGLADQVYQDVNLLKNVNDTLTINGTDYVVVIKPVDDPSTGYQGMVLLDRSTNSLIVVNRGTKGATDLVVDAVMADQDINEQWSDALKLAQQAKDYADANGITNIYAVGHSLGGSLAQMQAAYFGWRGVTFNAYGTDELFKAMPGYTISPNANITNYRTMYDLVSDASVQIGTVITLETPNDQKLFSSGISHHPVDFIAQIMADHSLSNFFDAGTDIDGTQNPNDLGDHIYNAAPAFNFPALARTVALAQDQVAEVVATLETVVEYEALQHWWLLPLFPRNIQDQENAAKDAWELLTGQTLSGISADIPADPLLQNALDPDPTYNIDRAALAGGSSVVVQGGDPTQVASYSLWAPGQTSGLTKEYLIAREGLVQARAKFAGAGDYAGSTITTDDQNSYVYTDLSQSPNPLYTLNGTGPDTYSIEFGTDGSDTLHPTLGTLSQLYGGAGDDMLVDGSGTSTLEGGAGNDQYWINGTEAGTDHILDTDGEGNINWDPADGGSLILTGGDAVPGSSEWKSADGSITYTELAAADGTTQLEVHSGNKTVYVDDFTNGELGITLNAGTAPVEGSDNLASLRSHGLIGNTDIPGDADYVYTNNADSGPVASIVGADMSGSAYGNEIGGEGYATSIYAGNGDNVALIGDFSYQATVPLATPISAMLQGGSGNQDLVGVGNGTETIIGGAVGTDTTADTYIDGGGATALLIGGGQNSVIFGGTGADTLVASSADSGSFEPFTYAMAGVSFWGEAYSGQLDENGNPYQQTALPTVTTVASSPDDVQINLSLYQSDGSFGTPFGLLGSSYDPGEGSTTLPGSELIGGTGSDWLIGNVGNDTIIGGDPADTVAGVGNAILVGGAGADLIYGGGGTEFIYADMTPEAASNWADLDPDNADTIQGGNGADFIYGSGGNDVIYAGSGSSIIHVGNGNSYVDAGSGDATIYGGSGNDTIVADALENTIQTGDGNAYVIAQGGQALIATGAAKRLFWSPRCHSPSENAQERLLSYVCGNFGSTFTTSDRRLRRAA